MAVWNETGFKGTHPDSRKGRFPAHERKRKRKGLKNEIYRGGGEGLSGHEDQGFKEKTDENDALKPELGEPSTWSKKG